MKSPIEHKHSNLHAFYSDTDYHHHRQLIFVFNNGFGASVIWGSGSYTEHKTDGYYHKVSPECMNCSEEVEIGPLGKGNSLDGMILPHHCEYDDVIGYNKMDEFIDILKEIRDLPKDFEPKIRHNPWDDDETEESDSNADNNYERVNRTKFIKLALRGEIDDVIIVPCKCSKDSDFANNTTISAMRDIINTGGITKEDIVKYLNAFEYYNCNNELGKYPHYYIKKE